MEKDQDSGVTTVQSNNMNVWKPTVLCVLSIVVPLYEYTSHDLRSSMASGPGQACGSPVDSLYIYHARLEKVPE